MLNPETVVLNFSMKNCQKDVSYQIKITNEDPSLGKVKNFETEELKCLANGEELKFKETITLNFCFDKRQKLKINTIKKIPSGNKYEVKESERHTVLSSLVTSPNSTYERPLKKDQNIDILCIKINKIITNISSKKNDSIFEYLKAGVQLSCFIGLDFSNGINNQSLEESKKIYLTIIGQIISKIGIYTKNNFYMYGYGATLKNSNKKDSLSNFIFNINMKENNCLHFENFQENYFNCLNNIIPEKKVLLSSLVRNITKEIYRIYNEKYYNVLFILARELTDEKDKQETIDAFIESGYLPLTIIIIGEGKNDFNKMKELFGKKIIETRGGMAKNRNNIISISFLEEFNGNSEKIVEWCLREINKQMIEFYSLAKSSPESIKKNKTESIKQSIQIYSQSIVNYESRVLFPSQIKNQKEEDLDEDEKINNIQNFQKIHHENKKKEEEETPKGKYRITPEQSINPQLSNAKNYYGKKEENNEKEKKYTPGNSIISNDYNFNNFGNQKNNNYQNLTQDNKYRLTPGQSILPEIKGNPYQEKMTPKPREYRIPQASINPTIKNNPYQKPRPTPEGPPNYFIPKNSVMPDNQNNISNPYNKDKINIKNDSGTSEIISTNNSNNNSNSYSNNNEAVRGSNMYRLNNYSIDSSQMK